MSQEKQSQLFFELGQIIKISAPSNPNVNEKIYLIDYLDDNLIKLINDTDFTKIELKININKTNFFIIK